MTCKGVGEGGHLVQRSARADGQLHALGSCMHKHVLYQAPQCREGWWRHHPCRIEVPKAGRFGRPLA